MLKALQALERARELPEGEIPREFQSALREIESEVTDFDRAIGGYKNHLWRVWHWAAFEIFIWHLMVPVSMAFWAICFLFDHLAPKAG